MDEFEQEKEEEIEENIGGKVAKQVIKQGWGEWAGSGVDQSGYEARRKKADLLRQQKIDELKKKRTDLKMKGVQLNTEERDKKFV